MVWFDSLFVYFFILLILLFIFPGFDKQNRWHGETGLWYLDYLGKNKEHMRNRRTNTRIANLLRYSSIVADSFKPHTVPSYVSE